MDDLAVTFERTVWTTPFYKAISHGVYAAYYDICVDPRTGQLTKQGEEFLSKKKIKVAFVCHAGVVTAAPSGTHIIYISREATESVAALENWIKEVVIPKAAAVLMAKEGNIAVLSVSANGLICATLAAILMRCRAMNMAQAVTTICQAVGGGAVLGDILHQEVILNVAKHLEVDTTISAAKSLDLRQTVDAYNDSQQSRVGSCDSF